MSVISEEDGTGKGSRKRKYEKDIQETLQRNSIRVVGVECSVCTSFFLVLLFFFLWFTFQLNFHVNLVSFFLSFLDDTCVSIDGSHVTRQGENNDDES